MSWSVIAKASVTVGADGFVSMYVTNWRCTPGFVMKEANSLPTERNTSLLVANATDALRAPTMKFVLPIRRPETDAVPPPRSSSPPSMSLRFPWCSYADSISDRAAMLLGSMPGRASGGRWPKTSAA